MSQQMAALASQASEVHALKKRISELKGRNAQQQRSQALPNSRALERPQVRERPGWGIAPADSGGRACIRNTYSHGNHSPAVLPPPLPLQKRPRSPGPPPPYPTASQAEPQRRRLNNASSAASGAATSPRNAHSLAQGRTPASASLQLRPPASLSGSAAAAFEDPTPEDSTPAHAEHLSPAPPADSTDLQHWPVIVGLAEDVSSPASGPRIQGGASEGGGEGGVQVVLPMPPAPPSPLNKSTSKRACECGRASKRTWGFPGQRLCEARWCKLCPGRPAGTTNLATSKTRCECGKKMPTYGFPSGPRRHARDARWCLECKLPGAVNVVSKRCRCGAATPIFSLPGTKGGTWCAKCPDRPPEAVDVLSKKCECGKGRPSQGLPGWKAKDARWW